MRCIPYKNGFVIPVEWEKREAKGHCLCTHEGMVSSRGEGLHWLNAAMLDTIGATQEIKQCLKSAPCTIVNTQWRSIEAWVAYLEHKKQGKKRVHLLALGDVGSTVLTALKLLGGDCIETLGIYDVNENVCQRWESELNQAAYPWAYDTLPNVEILTEETLFDCDMFVFCASKGIPPLDSKVQDVRMAQFEANRGIVSQFAKKAAIKRFQGIFAVVSDPVDPLCREAFFASNVNESGDFIGAGLLPEQIKGYGLGVMNARAAYYAKRDEQFASFLTEGRAFGPHGSDLIIANSISNYDDELSKALTTLAVEANLRTRELGFKPYIAPAISSAAISLLLTLRGEWHYSSVFLGGVYMGCRNRVTSQGVEIETLPLPDDLYKRLEKAYTRLEELL